MTQRIPLSATSLPEVPDFPKFRNLRPDNLYQTGPSQTCCLNALILQYSVRNRRLIRNDDVDFVRNITDGLNIPMDGPAFYERASQDNSQFPCGALYDIDRTLTAPDVQVPYIYCRDNCTGWLRSDTKDLNSWLQPFIGFILPAIFFSFIVPRRLKLSADRGVFKLRAQGFRNVPLLAVNGFLAFLAAVFDAFGLLAMTVALAGPMMASGFFEAVIDNRVLNYVQSQDLHIRDKIDLMFITLVGNLNQDPAWLAVRILVGKSSSEHDSPAHIRQSDRDTLEMAHMVEQSPMDFQTQVDLREPDRNTVVKWKRRLKAMLGCQYDFGPITGIPVMFYLGSFVFVCLEIRLSLGDENVSESLSYGIFWMICPHVAIVSGLLLAGNNPNTLEAITPISADLLDKLKQVSIKHTNGVPQSFFHPLYTFITTKIYGPVYESAYQPVEMWTRGRSKYEWLLRLHYTTESAEAYPNLHEVLTFGFGAWTLIFGYALSLIAVPAALSIVTIYYTPAIGISCRSLSYLIYAGCQVLLIALWAWGIFGWGMPLPSDPSQNWAAANRRENKRSPRLEMLLSRTWYFFFTITIAISVFVSVGGTLMQLIGVYRNCLCALPARWWMDLENPKAVIPVGANTWTQQHFADQYWLACGLAAAVFLVLMTFLGWWWQTSLRSQFGTLLGEGVDDVGTKHDEEASGVGKPGLPVHQPRHPRTV